MSGTIEAYPLQWPFGWPRRSSGDRVRGRFSKGEQPTFEEELAKDVLEIITVFSARLYGSRSKKNKDLIEAMKKAAES